jgi:hypothetical protein
MLPYSIPQPRATFPSHPLQPFLSMRAAQEIMSTMPIPKRLFSS